jgi:hypothetical protein
MLSAGAIGPGSRLQPEEATMVTMIASLASLISMVAACVDPYPLPIPLPFP